MSEEETASTKRLGSDVPGMLKGKQGDQPKMRDGELYDTRSEEVSGEQITSGTRRPLLRLWLLFVLVSVLRISCSVTRVEAETS